MPIKEPEVTTVASILAQLGLADLSEYAASKIPLRKGSLPSNPEAVRRILGEDWISDPKGRARYNLNTREIRLPRPEPTMAAHELGHKQLHDRWGKAYERLAKPARLTHLMAPAISGLGLARYLRQRGEGDHEGARRTAAGAAAGTALATLPVVVDEGLANRKAYQTLAREGILTPGSKRLLRKSLAQYAVRGAAPAAVMGGLAMATRKKKEGK